MYKCKVSIKQVAARLSAYLQIHFGDENVQLQNNMDQMIQKFFDKSAPQLLPAAESPSDKNSSPQVVHVEEDEDTLSYGTEDPGYEDEQIDLHYSSSSVLNKYIYVDEDSLASKILACCEDGKLPELKLLLMEWSAGSSETRKLGPFSADAHIGPHLSTMLHAAAKKNQVEIIDYLCTTYNNIVDAEDDIGATPLFYAVANHNDDAAAMLLKFGASVNHKDKYTNYPLIIALKTKNFKLADMLRIFKASTTSKGKGGNTALMEMCAQGNLEAVKFLLEDPASSSSLALTNDRGENVLFQCVKHIHVLDYMLKYINENIETKQRNRLLRAVSQQTRFNLIHAVVHNSNMEALLCIVNRFPDDVLKEMLNEKESKLGLTPLMIAVFTKDTDIIELLLNSAEVDVNAQNLKGNTALHIALKKDEYDIARRINQHGQASIKIKNNKRVSPKGTAKSRRFNGLIKPDSKYHKVLVQPETWLREVVAHFKYTVILFLKGTWQQTFEQPKLLGEMNRFVGPLRKINAEVVAICADPKRAADESILPWKVEIDMFNNPDGSLASQFQIPISSSGSNNILSKVRGLFAQGDRFSKSIDLSQTNPISLAGAQIVDRRGNVLFKWVWDQQKTQTLSAADIFLILSFYNQTIEHPELSTSATRQLFEMTLKNKETKELFREFLKKQDKCDLLEFVEDIENIRMSMRELPKKKLEEIVKKHLKEEYMEKLKKAFHTPMGSPECCVEEHHSEGVEEASEAGFCDNIVTIELCHEIGNNIMYKLHNESFTKFISTRTFLEGVLLKHSSAQ